MDPRAAFDLLDWKRRVFALYAAIREEPDHRRAWQLWRETRDRMFGSHPQSPLPELDRASFVGLDFFDYDPASRVLAEIGDAPSQHYELPESTGGTMAFSRVGRATFTLNERELELELYWLEGYGGGLFLPFKDRTAGAETYGAGRYLLDTIKGADLGVQDGKLVLDFNFAYNPSCSYDPRWSCPLAPQPNHLPVEVRAGERVS